MVEIGDVGLRAGVAMREAIWRGLQSPLLRRVGVEGV